MDWLIRSRCHFDHGDKAKSLVTKKDDIGRAKNPDLMVDGGAPASESRRRVGRSVALAGFHHSPDAARGRKREPLDGSGWEVLRG